MTLSGIITMILSIGFVWGLLTVCVHRLLRDPGEKPARKKAKS